MSQSLQLLFDEGGPALRYLVATEFGFPMGLDLAPLQRELLASAEVQKCLGNLSASAQTGIRPNTIHGCADTCYENAMGKLVQYGVRAGMPELDARTEPFMRWLAEFPGGEKYLFGSFYSTLVASLLAMAGYRDEAVVRVLYNRLSWTYDFCRQSRYDIYVDKMSFRGIPKVWANVPLIETRDYVRIPRRSQSCMVFRQSRLPGVVPYAARHIPFPSRAPAGEEGVSLGDGYPCRTRGEPQAGVVAGTRVDLLDGEAQERGSIL